MNSNFKIKLNENSNNEMIIKKNEAMENKKNYIDANKNNLKEVFLKQYSESGKLLEKDYKNYSIDQESLKIILGIDIENIVNTRIENSKIIYEKLKNSKELKFLVEDYNGEDGLLFVPIILDTKKRDDLRKYLIDNKIYLPIHWPLEKRINNIVGQELSLVCDQRYNKNEISEYIDLIIKYL